MLGALPRKAFAPPWQPLTQAMEVAMTHAESDPIVIACESTAGTTAMMGRVPVDLQATTREVKHRLERVIVNLEAVVQQKDPIFQDPRNVFFEISLAAYEIEGAAHVMRRAWWP
jgi:hypothetical protein